MQTPQMRQTTGTTWCVRRALHIASTAVSNFTQSAGECIEVHV